MGLYQPRNLIPYLQCIDGTQENEFKCQINGTECTGYRYQILTADNQVVSEQTDITPLSPSLYNGDILNFIIPANTLTNGNDYKWNIRLYQKASTMLVGYGTVTGSKVDSIAITPPTEAEQETIKNVKYKHLKINDQTRAVSTYDATLNRFTMAESFSWTAVDNGTKVEVYNSDEDGKASEVIYTGTVINSTLNTVCMKPNTYATIGHQIKIQGVTKTITAFNDTTWVATLDSNLSTIPTWGAEYQVYSDFIDSNPEAPFYVRANAQVEITNVIENQEINNRYYEFLGSYSQAQNVEMKFHKWKLWVTDENNIESLIEETEDIYSANLRFSFNEFRNGLKYRIQLIVEDEFDRTFESSSISFSISYQNPDVEVTPVATFLPDKTAINLRWGNTADFTPTISSYMTRTYYSDGTYTNSNESNKVYNASTNEVVSTTVSKKATVIHTVEYSDWDIIDGMPKLGLKSRSVPKGETITWSKWTKEDRTGVLDVSENFCISWYQKFDSDFEGDILNFTRTDDEGIEHIYRVWLPEETDLENKYKFKYNLDGVTGSYTWDTIAQKFCLQASTIIMTNEDYIYADELLGEQQTWIDTNYFVESGTRGTRLSKHWWKFVLTKDELIVQRGSD